jgi:hypothetical protein
VFCCKSLTVMRRIVNLDKNLAFLWIVKHFPPQGPKIDLLITAILHDHCSSFDLPKGEVVVLMTLTIKCRFTKVLWMSSVGYLW